MEGLEELEVLEKRGRQIILNEWSRENANHWADKYTEERLVWAEEYYQHTTVPTWLEEYKARRKAQISQKMPWLEIERLEENAQFFREIVKWEERCSYSEFTNQYWSERSAILQKEFFLETGKTCYPPDWWLSDWKRRHPPPLNLS